MALMGFFPSQYCSGSTGETRFLALGAHVPLRHRQSAGSGLLFWVPQANQNPAKVCTVKPVRVVWRRLLGFDPVNQPCVVIRRTRY
jgi:hypothetical protein